MSTPSVSISSESLLKRRDKVVELLRPLAGNQSPGCDLSGVARNSRAIAAFGSGTRPLNYSDWRFRSFVSDIWCQYYEVWNATHNSRSWYIYRAYLTIYRLDRVTHKFIKVVGIHADPDATDDEPLRSYKRGPHLHVFSASEPIPKCHFPLNLGHLDETLASIDAITKAFSQAVAVLSHDVLTRFKNA